MGWGEVSRKLQYTPGRRRTAQASFLLVFILASFWTGKALSGTSRKSGEGVELQDSFQFSTHSYSNYLPTLVGNGYLSTSTPWNGASASEATLAGLYDHLEQNSYTYQALIPSWNRFDYWNGSHWLDSISPATVHLEGYLQTLDTRRGLLTTRFDWVDGVHVTHVKIVEFVSRQESHLGVVQVQLTPDYGVTVGPVTFSFPLGGEKMPPFVWEGAELPGPVPIRRVRPDGDLHGFMADCETRDGKTQVAEAVRVALPSTLPPMNQVNLGFSPSLASPALNVKFIAQAGKTYTFTKFVAVFSSLDSQSPASQAQALARQAEALGFDKVLQQHESDWEKLWTTDILIRGDVEAQRAVHAAMYYLFSDLRAGADASVPAMALPSRAYLGRIWWDADTWIFPAALALHPHLARSIIDYRGKRLAAAEQNARERGFRGALFPMESAHSGEEAAPEWSSEIHVTGDVALAQWRYYQATGDTAWLRSHGYPVIKEVADFWASRATYDQQQHDYQILHVTGPNEAITDVNNDAYTNAIAQRTMQVAIEAARLLGETPDPEWMHVASGLVIPYDEQRQVHMEHSGDEQGMYAHALILLTYPLGMAFSTTVARNDLSACLKNFGKPGYEVGMLGNFYSIVASQLGQRDLAYKLFLSMVRSYAQPPFDAMTETPSNGRAVFLTAEGAFLQQIIFGFTGLRWTDGGLKPVHPPLLPPTWQSLELRGIKSRGNAYNIRVTSANRLVMTQIRQ
jgi:trehalose/maltose hydrolase-like predicted phosphorylase